MNGFLVTLFALVSILLVGGILLQPGSKGGGLGSSFGGGSANSAFGARGAAPVLAKVTYWLAGGFLALALVIEAVIIRNSQSVLDKKGVLAPKAAATPAPALPVPTAPSK